MKGKVYINTSHEYKCKTPQQDNKQSDSKSILKGLYTLAKWDLF